MLRNVRKAFVQRRRLTAFPGRDCAGVFLNGEVLVCLYEEGSQGFSYFLLRRDVGETDG